MPIRGRGLLLYSLAWLPYLALYTAALAATGAPLDLAARGGVVNVLPDAVMGALVFARACGRARSARRLWIEGVSFLLAANAAWAALLTLDAALFARELPPASYLRILPWRLLTGILIYAALVAAGSAWRQGRIAREESERAARADALRARAELAAMRSQLNPHFVLNTFHALLGLVRRDPALAERGLERLGDLLRASLRVQREGRDEVSLGEEWRMVETYLELEGLRLGDRLRVTTDLPAALCALPVPSFAVQTLVENAVRHAVAARPDGGRLAVSAKCAAGGLRIEVSDDGNGSRADDGEGLGLTLLRERLAALYDGHARLALEQGREGTRAVLELPAPDER